MNSIAIDIIGYSALVINLYSMSVKGEYKLRLISALANFIYIIYGIFINALPIIIGCSIAVALHIYRLRKLKQRTLITINKAKETDVEILALLGTITYTESHGHFIDNKNDLMKYNENAFSVSKTKKDIKDPKNIFYILYKDDLPIGYAKLVLNAFNENVASHNNCQLERIYILNDFIPLKIGQQFLTFLEKKVKELKLDTVWLSVYEKNIRAIRFYQRNNYKEVGKSIFLVNEKEYKNIVFEKSLSIFKTTDYGDET